MGTTRLLGMPTLIRREDKSRAWLLGFTVNAAKFGRIRQNVRETEEFNPRLSFLRFRRRKQ